MTANVALVLFLIAFWGLLATAVKVGNWWAGRRWSDGPSLIPMIPFVPAVAGGVGWLVNVFASPWGSWGVVSLHVGWLVVSLGGTMRHPRPHPNAEPRAPADGGGT